MSHSKFVNSMGNPLLKGLFLETSYSDTKNVLYTLKDRDYENYKSLYRLYMEEADPTEWKFANKYLDGWYHWERLSQSDWFRPYVERWRRELELKIKSEALSRIHYTSKSGGKEAFTASRFLVEKGWEPKDGQTKRGRPSKEEIAKAAKEHLNTASRLKDDAQRLGITFQ